jgi:tRNA(fMet)-specific endonuclease VapC
MKYMLDTNICIYAQKGFPSVLSNLKAKKNLGIAISTVSLAELEYGVQASSYPEKNALALMKFLAIANILPFDNYAAIEYGRIRAVLRKQGTPIGTMDMLIAAHAKASGLIIVTNNVREFERIPGLEWENWVVCA